MKNLNLYFCSILIFFLSLTILGQKNSESESKTRPGYNAELAKKLGADYYGMRSYVFVILKTGKVDVTDEKKRKELFAGHFANMGRLAKEGLLVLAGPFVEDKEKRGLFILNVTTIEEARKLVETDPTVKAGIFDVEYTKYYGSAALMQINEIHSKVQKKDM